MEIWKPISGYPKYEISTYGRIKSLYIEVERMHPLHGRMCTYRYKERITIGSTYGKKDKRLMFNLCRDGAHKGFLVSRLVLTEFAGSPQKGMVCCHNNGNPLDNRLDNLRWDTLKANAKDMAEHGTRRKGMQVHFVKLTDDDIYTIRSITPRRGLYKELAAYYNVHWETIRDIIKKRTWKHL